MLTDPIGGQVGLAVMSLPSDRASREPAHPSIPTLNEGRGIKGLDCDLWIGLFAPAQTPPAVVERLAAAVSAAIASPALHESQTTLGASTLRRTGPALFRPVGAERVGTLSRHRRACAARRATMNTPA